MYIHTCIGIWITFFSIECSCIEIRKNSTISFDWWLWKDYFTASLAINIDTLKILVPPPSLSPPLYYNRTYKSLDIVFLTLVPSGIHMLIIWFISFLTISYYNRLFREMAKSEKQIALILLNTFYLQIQAFGLVNCNFVSVS